jgi:hypothetical protein
MALLVVFFSGRVYSYCRSRHNEVLGAAAHDTLVFALRSAFVLLRVKSLDW